MTGVTFITTVRNEAETIGAYLDSLAKQSRPPDEVVIVDGESTDGTVEEIRSRSHLFGSLQVIVARCNIAEGRNIAVRAATHDIIVMSDAGAILDSRWLEEIVRPLLEDPGVEIVAGNWRIAEEKGIRRVLRAVFLRSRPCDGLSDPRNPSARSFAIRKDVWLELGGHPEFLYAGEDTLFNIKWRLHHRNCCVADKAVCYWRMHVTLRGFGRQVFNYGRAGGRLARRSTLRFLAYLSREVAVYGTSIFMAIVAIGIGGVAGWVLIGLSVLLAGIAFVYRRGRHFAGARRHGLTTFASAIAVGVGVYRDICTAAGALAGLRDRARDPYEMLEREYLIMKCGTTHQFGSSDRTKET